jgi:tetratricopeptide (TPR) repeat protein
MSAWLGGIVKDPDKRAILSWIGGGAVVVAGGIWTVVTFVVDHKDAHDKKGDTNITVQQGIGQVGEIHGPVNIGPSPEQIAQMQKSQGDQLAVKDAQIAELHKIIETLVEKNPSAGPGAQQAVAGAVQSIAQGAEEGHPRLQEALDLLKENKTAEAAQLLNAVAEDKTTQAEKDRKEAAIAYRNLGAIAGLRDPKAAREAYAKSVALDPENAEGLFGDGWFQLSAKNLTAAEKSYRTLLQLAGNGADEDQIFWASTGLGDIAVARGHLNAALADYGEARSVMERLAGSDAGYAGWQRDLSVSYNKIGGVLVAQGNLPEALKSCRAGLAIRERFAGSDAGYAGWQCELLVSNTNIGDVLVSQGNLSEALKSYRAGLVIAERLAGSDAGNADWQRGLSVSNNKIGDVLVSQGNLAEAEKSYRAGLLIRERLAGSDAGNAEWQRDLFSSNIRIGYVLAKQDKFADALNSYRAGLHVIEQLAGFDTGNADWQRDLSISNNKIGDVLVKQGNLAEALKSYRAGLVIRERLAGSDAGNADWQRNLALSYGNLGDVHRRSGDKAKARDFLRQGQAIMARLTKLSPDNAGWKNDLTWFDGQIKELDRGAGPSRASARPLKHP